MSQYTPRPAETSEVVIPDSLQTLLEKLAENAHEVWAAERISQGWTYGEQRDDTQKLHPCLKPYDELPESEKEFDRKTSEETLRLVLKLGYKIVPSSE